MAEEVYSCEVYSGYNNHWVTASSPTESGTSVVYLYGSLQKESLNKNLIKQIARLRKSEDAKLRIISKAVQQQGNRNDCGIFAIAFATDIAYNHKPEQRTYKQSVIRKHLLAQLENETMTPFPQQTKQVKRVKLLYGNARNVNKSRNMPSRTVL